ncbi:MAG: hypothetical protein C4337_09680 [Armatimonadota bacterium]
MQSFFTTQQRDGDILSAVLFFTGDPLGLLVMAPLDLSETDAGTSEARLSHTTGLLILKQDGAGQGFILLLRQARGGVFLEEIELRDLKAQQQRIRELLAPQNQAEYRLLTETGKEYKRDKAPSYPNKASAVALRQIDGSTVREYDLRWDQLSTLLSEPGARLDKQGQLYLPGWKMERRLRELRIEGSAVPLELEDGCQLPHS